MKKTALILALAFAMPAAAIPAWAQDKQAEKPAAREAAPQPAPGADQQAAAEPSKAETPRRAPRKHSRRHEDARHCLNEPTNTAIIKCAEAYL